jgi:hypothetical protein
VAALPHTLGRRIPAEADATAERPDTNEGLEAPTRRGDARGKRVGRVDNVDSSLKPLTCCRFGDSSTIPLRMMPGKPTPTAAMAWPRAAASTCVQMTSAICSAGMDWSGLELEFPSG